MKKFFMDNDKLSMGRLLSFITCLTGLTIGIIGALNGKFSSSLATVSVSFVSLAMGQKVISKLKE